MDNQLTPNELETQKKQSQAKQGIKNPMYAKHHSADTKRRISQSCEKYHATSKPQGGNSDTPVSDRVFGRSRD